MTITIESQTNKNLQWCQYNNFIRSNYLSVSGEHRVHF